jgi:hypothetical protein
VGVIESDGDGGRRWEKGRKEGCVLEGETSGERGRREQGGSEGGGGEKGDLSDPRTSRFAWRLAQNQGHEGANPAQHAAKTIGARRRENRHQR